ncbi:hypothetical protein M404DRAFT_999893 [Pisolithus tinctorius Marx 270]|uniref:Uncharacterized protein n=1 Tax=Pisolithus tinctorius Marx 270 TaxID=870435 RepID=A0A0C3J8C5_PISTI|nr:hypothetical protein M404DRAFT_999893 [Pisolithus tinctorius Marx 270]
MQGISAREGQLRLGDHTPTHAVQSPCELASADRPFGQIHDFGSNRNIRLHVPGHLYSQSSAFVFPHRSRPYGVLLFGLPFISVSYKGGPNRTT